MTGTKCAHFEPGWALARYEVQKILNKKSKSFQDDVEPKLNALEREVISLFVKIASMLTLPRSVGEVYGLLYVSPEALCMNDCMERLDMSKGSVSQAFKVLRSFGAVHSVYLPGIRREYFQAERVLRRMTAGFLSEQVQPQLEETRDQIRRIETILAKKPDFAETELKGRIAQLRKWERRANRILPFLLRLIVRPGQGSPRRRRDEEATRS